MDAGTGCKLHSCLRSCASRHSTILVLFLSSPNSPDPRFESLVHTARISGYDLYFSKLKMMSDECESFLSGFERHQSAPSSFAERLRGHSSGDPS